jgi:acetylornithine deacetylase
MSHDFLNRTVDLLGPLITFPTVSSDSNRALIDWCAARLEAAGARVRISADDSGAKANLWASMGPEGDGGIVLSGHSDVVPAEEEGWLSDPFEMAVRDGRLYGRGTCDMKGFLAASLALAERIEAGRLKRPLHFSFTYDEEVGCLGARALVQELAVTGPRPALAIIGEPTGMGIIEAHKGCCEYTTRVHGLEGHASRPDQGVSAVEFAVRYAAGLLDLRAPLAARAPEGSPFTPPWTTLQIGQIAGGTARNVIAGACEVLWEMRPVQEADRGFVLDAATALIERELLPAMRAVHPEAAIETEVIGEVAGLEHMSENEAREIVRGLTGQTATDVVAFSTEAGLFQGLGMSAVVCGPGAIAQAHKANEFVSLEQLAACCDMLAKLGDQLTGR